MRFIATGLSLRASGEIFLTSHYFARLVLTHMQQYIIRRLLLFIPTLIIVSLVAFGLVRLIPGDVVVVQLSESPFFREEDADALREKLGLDDPWPVQYVEWVSDIARGDLGQSLWSQKPVSSMIGDRVRPTLEIALLAFVLANTVAILFGVISAVNQDGWSDYVLRLISIVGLAIPNFWLGTLIIVFGANYFGYVPKLTPVAFTSDPFGHLKQYIIPATVIAWSSSATITRIVRSSMLEVLRQDYMRTARAKGLTERTVIYSHGLKNAMLPVITLQGFQLGSLLSGSIIIEIVFGLPGLGRLAFDSVTARDYTVLQGLILMFAAVVLIINFLIDLSYAWLDPRVKYS